MKPLNIKQKQILAYLAQLDILINSFLEYGSLLAIDSDNKHKDVSELGLQAAKQLIPTLVEYLQGVLKSFPSLQGSIDDYVFTFHKQSLMTFGDKLLAYGNKVDAIDQLNELKEDFEPIEDFLNNQFQKSLILLQKEFAKEIDTSAFYSPQIDTGKVDEYLSVVRNNYLNKSKNQPDVNIDNLPDELKEAFDIYTKMLIVDILIKQKKYGKDS